MNFPETDDAVFGNYANKVEESFIYQVRKINYELMNLAIKNKKLFISDLSLLQNKYGNGFIFDPRLYVNADLPISLEALPIVAKSLTDIILSTNGILKKCLILDLDNILWGGIIAEDGIENIQIGNLGIGKAFTEVQLWAKQLKERGILLAICSKNIEETAKEPFINHPDMILRQDDIAIFVANWNSKSDNIRYIQSKLNIAYDSMVFLDDDRLEREMVRSNFPQISIPDLPEDPAEYLSYLQTLDLFETASFSKEDEVRTRQYQEEAERDSNRQKVSSTSDFLSGIEMIADINAFENFNIPRVSQLSQRSNQFNLRTVRYTEDDLLDMKDSDEYITFSFSLEDKFGKYGIVSAAVLKKTDPETAFIENWIMSCRVFNRGMDHFTMNNIVKKSAKRSIKKLTAEYIPSSKNQYVKDLLPEFGFSKNNGLFELKVDQYVEKINYITSR